MLTPDPRDGPAPLAHALTDMDVAPAFTAALIDALTALTVTVPAPAWDAEIRRRTLALVLWRGETLISLAKHADRAHSYYAKKLGSAPCRPFTLADLVDVLHSLAAAPSLLLDPQPAPASVRGAKGRPRVPVEAAPSAPPVERTPFVDALIEPHRHLLGTMSDRALAEQLGVAKGRIFRARQRYGIAGTVDHLFRPRE